MPTTSGASPVSNYLSAHTTLPSVPQIYAGVVVGGARDGGCASVAGVNVNSDVGAFAVLLQTWSASLRSVESRHIAVHGPWAQEPTVADIARLVETEPLSPITPLSSVVGATGDYFFLVRILVLILQLKQNRLCSFLSDNDKIIQRQCRLPVGRCEMHEITPCHEIALALIFPL